MSKAKTMDISKSSFKELEALKSDFQEIILEYRRLNNLCDKTLSELKSGTESSGFYELKDSLKYIYKNIDAGFKFLYKNLTLKTFNFGFEDLVVLIKKFSDVKKWECEDNIGKIDERLMMIGHKIFKELPNPKTDLDYQKAKEENQQKRDDILLNIMLSDYIQEK